MYLQLILLVYGYADLSSHMLATLIVVNRIILNEIELL